MDAFTLTAKLVLDSSGFETSLGAIEGNLQSGQSLTKFAAWGTAIGNVAAKAFTMAFRGATNFAKSVIDTGMGFDDMMQSVRSVRQMTDEEFNAMRDKAIELGRTTKFTAEEVAEGFFYEAIAGWSVEKMLSGIEGSLNLAAAAGENLGVTSDIVTDAMTGFGMAAEDTGHFVDVLAAAASNSNTTVSLMGQTFQYLAPIAGVLGYSIDDVAVGLGLIANNGIKGSKAGTALRQILASMVDPSEDAKQAMQDLGISLTDLDTGRMKTFGELVSDLRETFAEADFDLAGRSLEEVADAEEKAAAKMEDLKKQLDEGKLTQDQYNKMTEQAQQDLADFLGFNTEFLGQLADIAGTRGISALLALMKSTDEEFNKLTDSVANSEGEAERMASERLNSLKGDITLFNSALDGLKILVSDEYKSKLRDFVSVFTTEIGLMADAFQEGGLAGMFSNLSDWIINGIADALTADTTGADAQKFGKAVGDFVGNLIASLVENGDEILSGLFTAGVNLAGGLIEGLFSGLFGTGANTIPGFIAKAQEDEKDAIADANATAIQAQGIVGYMDSLVQKYGEAAGDTEEWANAMERLKELNPGVSSVIAEQSGSIAEMTGNLSAFIELTRQKAIEEAKNKTLNDLRQKYIENQTALAMAQQNVTSAQFQRDAAINSIVDVYKQYLGDAFTATQESFMRDSLAQGKYKLDKASLLYYQDELGLTAGTVEGYMNAYNEALKAMQENQQAIPDLEKNSASLEAQLAVAEAAAAAAASSITAMGESATGASEQVNGLKESIDGLPESKTIDITVNYHTNGSIDGSHAKGAWNIPYDNYIAVLHRGEQVLTASQARQSDKGSGGASASDIAAAVRSAMMSLSLQMNSETVGRVMGDETTHRVNQNIAQMNRRAQYGYGG